MTGPGERASRPPRALSPRATPLVNRRRYGQARKCEAPAACVREAPAVEHLERLQHREQALFAVLRQTEYVNRFIALASSEQRDEHPLGKRGFVHPFSVSQYPESLSSFSLPFCFCFCCRRPARAGATAPAERYS